MPRTKSEAQVRGKVEVTPYEYTNATINRLLDEDETLFVVQGPYGRVPLLADTEEEAVDRYVARFLHEIEEDEVEAVTEAVA